MIEARALPERGAKETWHVNKSACDKKERAPADCVCRRLTEKRKEIWVYMEVRLERELALGLTT